MPGLQSFCIYASIGLACIFLLQISWFVAWLVLDERRIRANKNGILPCCITHQHHQQADSKTDNNQSRPNIAITEGSHNKNHQNDIKQNKNTRKLSLKITETLVKQLSHSVKLNLFPASFSEFRPALVRSCYSSPVFRVLVLTLSSGLLAGGTYGFKRIEYKFDPVELVPAESYFTKFIERKSAELASSSGYSAQVFTGEINGTHLQHISFLHSQLDRIVQQENILESYESWWNPFIDYLDQKTEFQSWQNLTQEDFRLVVSDFLHSKSGSKFQRNFNFERSLECGSPAPRILASSLEILYLPFDGPSQHGPARAAIEELLSSSGLPGAISFNKIYLSWETDQIIDTELWRNVGLGLCCVFLVTLVLLANIQVSLMVRKNCILTKYLR